MPFTSLLLTGLVPNGKFEENHVGVALFPSNQAEGETMLLFKADDSDFHNVYLHQKTQQGKSTPSCCDLVCFAHKLLKSNNGKDKPEITICLIELKGGKNDQTKKASDQISETYEGIRAGIIKSEIKEVNIIWKALLIDKSSIPNADDQLCKKLPKAFKTVKVYHARANDRAIINLTIFMQKSVVEKIT